MFSGFNLISYLDYRPKYELNKCVKSKSSKSKCSACVDRCQYNEIEVFPKGIKIKETCKQCGICSSYCMTNALTDGGRKFLFNREKIYVVCRYAAKEHGSISEPRALVDCLDYFSKKILLNLYSRGFKSIYTNMDYCETCKRPCGFLDEMKKVNQILALMDMEEMTIEALDKNVLDQELLKVKEEKKEVKVARRDFFKQLAKEAFNIGYEIAPPSVKENPWESTEEAIDKIKKNKDLKISLYEIKLREDLCIECGACLKLCPRQVGLKEDGKVIIRTDLCIGCGLCQDTCPTKALEVVEEAKLGEEILLEKSSCQCDHCGSKMETYFEGKAICNRCIAREALKAK